MARINKFVCEHPDHIGDRNCQYESDLTTGYGVDKNDHKHCYQCCALEDKKQMIETGKIGLYLVNGVVSNWPGSLKFKGFDFSTTSYQVFGRYMSKRETCHFIGPDNHLWQMDVRGDMDCGTARRLKAKHIA